MASIPTLTAISITDLALFTPLFPLGILLFVYHRRLSRYSFIHDPHSKTYLYLSAVCLLHLIAASLQLAAISVQNKSATTASNNVIGLQTTITRLFYIKLSPLLLASLGMLRRVQALSRRKDRSRGRACWRGSDVGKTHSRTEAGKGHEQEHGDTTEVRVEVEECEGQGSYKGVSSRLSLVLRLSPIAVAVALILVIAGASVSANDLLTTRKYTIQIMTEVGVALFVAAFAVTVLTACMVSVRQHVISPQERYALGAVLACVPFVLVRLVYTVLATFTTVEIFSIVDGLGGGDSLSLNGPGVVLIACMVDLEELIVVVGFIAVGFMLKRLDMEEREAGSGGSDG